jgi:ABC-type glycerol-3-phosphate transport system permease component
MKREVPRLALLLACAGALLWVVPFAWMGVASFRHNSAGAADLASLMGLSRDWGVEPEGI